jgi:hypothetical protein
MKKLLKSFLLGVVLASSAVMLPSQSVKAGVLYSFVFEKCAERCHGKVGITIAGVGAIGSLVGWAFNSDNILGIGLGVIFLDEAQAQDDLASVLNEQMTYIEDQEVLHDLGAVLMSTIRTKFEKTGEKTGTVGLDRGYLLSLADQLDLDPVDTEHLIQSLGQ